MEGLSLPNIHTKYTSQQGGNPAKIRVPLAMVRQLFVLSYFTLEAKDTLAAGSGPGNSRGGSQSASSIALEIGFLARRSARD